MTNLGIGIERATAEGIGGFPVNVLAYSYDSIGQGTWSMSAFSHYTGGYISNPAGIDGDNISYKIYLSAGTYTLKFLTILDATQGIVDIYLDAAEVASFDCYSAGQVPNSIQSQADIVVASSGFYTLKFQMDGKNGAAAAYKLYLSALTLYRTA